VRTLQAAGLVDVTPAAGMPTWEVLGVYPTWESLGCQLVLLAAAAVAAAHLVITRGRPAEVASDESGHPPSRRAHESGASRC